MNIPKISIITPSFNQADFLGQTLCSVLNQNYPNLEYVVIDGGSTDDSVEIIKRHEKHLKYWVSEKDSGQAQAINKGVEKTTGDILGYLNSDDILLPGSLEAVAEAYRRGGDWWSGSCMHFGEATKPFVQKPTDYRTGFGLFRLCGLAQPSTFWSRRALNATGPMNESLHMALDYEYWLRLYLKGFRLIPIRQPLSAFRHHPRAKTTTSSFVAERQEVYGRLIKELSWFDRILALYALRRNRLYSTIIENEDEDIFDLLKQILRNPDLLTFPALFRRLRFMLMKR